MPISLILPCLTTSVKHKNSYSPTFSQIHLVSAGIKRGAQPQPLVPYALMSYAVLPLMPYSLMLSCTVSALPFICIEAAHLPSRFFQYTHPLIYEPHPAGVFMRSLSLRIGRGAFLRLCRIDELFLLGRELKISWCWLKHCKTAHDVLLFNLVT